MEWIILRRRLLVVLIVVLMLAVAGVSRILFASGVAQLDRKELRQFAHQQSQLSHNNIQGGETPEKAPHE